MVTPNKWLKKGSMVLTHIAAEAKRRSGATKKT